MTHSGSVTLITHAATRSHTLLLHDVLYIPSISFRLLSLQKLVDADFVPLFKEIPGKVVLKETTSMGQMQQIAIMTICKGRLTLECKLDSRSSMAPPPTSICNHELHRSCNELQTVASRKSVNFWLQSWCLAYKWTRAQKSMEIENQGGGSCQTLLTEKWRSSSQLNLPIHRRSLQSLYNIQVSASRLQPSVPSP